MNFKKSWMRHLGDKFVMEIMQTNLEIELKKEHSIQTFSFAVTTLQVEPLAMDYCIESIQ